MAKMKLKFDPWTSYIFIYLILAVVCTIILAVIGLHPYGGLTLSFVIAVPVCLVLKYVEVI